MTRQNIFNQGPIDPDQQINRDHDRVEKNFNQSPAKYFQAESAEKIFIKVCPEIIEQGLHENRNAFRR
jgi:hypothetical protein